jgi:hypothetical protein
LPTDNAQALEQASQAIVTEARQLAAGIPLAASGAPDQANLRQLVELLALAGDESDLAEPLRFAPPRALQTLALQSAPELLITQTPGGQETVNLVVAPRNGDEQYYEGVPRSEAGEIITNQHQLSGGVCGIASPQYPGYACFQQSAGGQGEFIGHWMPPERVDEWLTITPSQLADPQMPPCLYDAPADTEAVLARQALMESVLEPETPDLPSVVLERASDSDFRTALAQRVAISMAPSETREARMAMAESGALQDHESAPSPSA